jgi:hypothetical protein
MEPSLLLDEVKVTEKNHNTRVTRQQLQKKVLQEAKNVLDRNWNGNYYTIPPHLCCIRTNGAEILHSQLSEIYTLAERAIE